MSHTGYTSPFPVAENTLIARSANKDAKSAVSFGGTTKTGTTMEIVTGLLSWKMFFIALTAKQHFNMNPKSFTLEQFRAWGAIGGKKSTRKLTSQEAKRMVTIREQKRAQKKVQNSSGHLNPV